MMKIRSGFEDFKRFVMRGNVLDLAVGVIVGGAFGKIVSSLVGDVIMPLVGLIAGQVNLAGLELTLVPAVGETAAVMLRYGAFLQSVVDFLIIAASVYLFVKLIGRFRRKQETSPMPVMPTKTEELLAEIRDIMKEQSGR